MVMGTPRGTPCRAVTPCAAPSVLHSGEYFLFESDSEEEEEAAAAVPEEPRPGRQSAFQVSVAGGRGGVGCALWVLMAPSPNQLAYQAWMTNTRTALRQQEREQMELPGDELGAGGAGGPQNGAGGTAGGCTWCLILGIL